jgi:signal transduction histidine kinase
VINRATERVVDDRIVRVVTLFAASAAAILAIALPATYFVTSWQREAAISQSEARSTAALIGEYAARNPLLWEFEGHRIAGMLMVNAYSGEWRVLGNRGEVVAEYSSESLAGAPLIRATATIFGGTDQPVGIVEVAHSITHVYFETAIVGICAILLAIVAFLALRWAPLRALERAFEHLWEARVHAERAEAETRAALARAEASDHSKSRFLSAMNHEFRTPIGQVMGFAELLLSEAQSGRDRTVRIEWLEGVHAAAQDLLGLLEDATRFARLDSAGHSLQVRTVPLHELAAGGVRLARSTLEQAGVTTHSDPSEGKAAFVVDAVLIEEAVGCLLREIARRSRPGSNVTIAYEHDAQEGAILLQCPDLDLTDAAIENLRAPLDAADVLTRGREGAGLGVAVAERIARLHGGRLWIGAGESGGVAMAVYLPAQRVLPSQ